MRASQATKDARRNMYANLRKQGMGRDKAFRVVGRRFPVVRGTGLVVK